jgi:imidazolonepropionase-like amidohydrolase
VVHADRAADIRAALALGREERLRIVLAGAAEAWRAAGEIAAAGVPVVVDPLANLPASFDLLQARPDDAARLAAAGVKLLIAPQRSDLAESHMARALPQLAGDAVAWGLPWPEAIRALTSNVAEVFGLDMGRVAAGTRADLVLWSGDPLELSSRPVAMWIGGRQVPLASRQQALLERYRRLEP